MDWNRYCWYLEESLNSSSRAFSRASMDGLGREGDGKIFEMDIYKYMYTRCCIV